MEKKRSAEVTIAAIIEITIGSIGIILFNFVALLLSHFSGSTSAWSSFILYMLGNLVALPMFFLVISGVGILKLNNLIRRISIYVLSPILFAYFGYFLLLLVIGFRRGLLASGVLILLIILILLSVFKIYFFTRTKVKEQFK